LNQDLKQMRGSLTMRISRGTEDEGRAHTNALRQEHAWHVPRREDLYVTGAD
jgi:hypothetical protein